MSKLKWLFALISISLMAACGGGGGDSTTDTLTGGDDTSTTELTSISGQAFDGYLKDAIVFCDLDGDLKRDSDEPAALSGEKGAYTLTGKNLQQCTVVVQVIPGETVDEDTPDVPVQSAYTLTAPVLGPEVMVSPLTTMVQQRMSAKGETLEQAQTAVRTALNVSSEADLFDDYIVKGDENLHTQAKAVVQAMVEFSEKYADSSFVDTKEILEAVTTTINADPATFKESDFAEKVLAVVDSGIFIVKEYNQDGSTIEYANDYSDSVYVTKTVGTWRVSEGKLVEQDPYSTAPSSTELIFGNEFYFSVSATNDQNQTVTRTLGRVVPFTSGMVSGKNFNFITPNFYGELSFKSDGTYSSKVSTGEGVDVPTWEIGNKGELILSGVRNLYLLPGSNSEKMTGILVDYSEDEMYLVALSTGDIYLNYELDMGWTPMVNDSNGSLVDAVEISSVLNYYRYQYGGQLGFENDLGTTDYGMQFDSINKKVYFSRVNYDSDGMILSVGEIVGSGSYRISPIEGQDALVIDTSSIRSIVSQDFIFMKKDGLVRGGRMEPQFL